MALEAIKQAANAGNIDGIEKWAKLAIKLSNTFREQMGALRRYRSYGKQEVIVKNVNVSEGGQAIVGNVKQGDGGGGGR